MAESDQSETAAPSQACQIERHSVTIGEYEPECETCIFIDDMPFLESFQQQTGQAILGNLILAERQNFDQFGFQGVIKDIIESADDVADGSAQANDQRLNYIGAPVEQGMSQYNY